MAETVTIRIFLASPSADTLDARTRVAQVVGEIGAEPQYAPHVRLELRRWDDPARPVQRLTTDLASRRCLHQSARCSQPLVNMPRAWWMLASFQWPSAQRSTTFFPSRHRVEHDNGHAVALGHQDFSLAPLLAGVAVGADGKQGRLGRVFAQGVVPVLTGLQGLGVVEHAGSAVGAEDASHQVNQWLDGLVVVAKPLGVADKDFQAGIVSIQPLGVHLHIDLAAQQASERAALEVRGDSLGDGLCLGVVVGVLGGWISSTGDSMVVFPLGEPRQVRWCGAVYLRRKSRKTDQGQPGRRHGETGDGSEGAAGVR